MALKQNNGGSDGVQSVKQPPAPKPNTTGAQSSEYSITSLDDGPSILPPHEERRN